LNISADGCTNINGQSVIRFSKQFLDTIETLQKNGFQLKLATVNFIVYWKKEDADHETKIVLPELLFEIV
jgi:ATP-dependent DNA helicase RecQ